MTPDAAAARVRSAPRATALCCDLDGTLAPISGDPDAVALPRRASAALATLAQALGTVAIVSGRPAAFLAARAAVPGVRLLGLYGLEEVASDGEVIPHPEAAAWEPAVARARSDLASALQGEEGVWLEDKGRSVAVHWRHAPDRGAAEARVVAEVERLAAATGLADAPGKLVAELRPPVAVDKGSAVATVANGHNLVVYAGDDLGDLPAFAEVRRRGGIAIGVDHGPETPPVLRDSCDVLVKGVDSLGRWLEDLARDVAG